MDKKTDLCRVYREFLGDFLNTFPEHKETVSKNEGLMFILAEVYDTDSVDVVVEHCKKVYPPKFFDLLYLLFLHCIF